MQNSGMNFPGPVSSRVKILVVDDHPNTAALLVRAISKLGNGVKAFSATSGHQALEYLQDGPVDVLITDMDMPEMTGLELIEKLHQHPVGAPTFTFLITASHVSGLQIAARRLNVTEVLSKPIHPQSVCQILRRALEEMDQFKLYKKLAAQKEFKILIADDQPDNVILLSRYLEGEGYAYVVAMDGIETLEQIHKANPDLVLLEAYMPGKDGFTVLEEIRADPAIQHIPVIILSAAWSNAAEIHPGLNLGADDYVSKPFDRTELFTRIRRKLLMKEVQYASIARKVT
jgi:CheY-like chemotaxis protein